MKKRVYLKAIYTIVIILVSITLIQVVYKIIKTSSCSYFPTMKNEDRYHYMFKDANERNFKTIYSSGRNKKGWLYTYDYKNELRITIWEFFEFNNLDVDDFHFIEKEDSAEIVGTYTKVEIGGSPEIKIEFVACLNFTNKNKVELLGEDIKIDTLMNQKYKIAYGYLKELTFVNASNELQIRINFSEELVNTNLIIFKREHNLMFIITNPIGSKIFNSDINDIFKLE